MDSTGLLVLLAYAGVIVNASMLAVIDPTYLLQTISSSLTLLVTTLYVVGSRCHKASMLNQLRIAMKEGKFITCEPFEIS